MKRAEKTKIRKSEVGKRFEKMLQNIGYSNKNTIDKVWQHKTRPDLTKAIAIEEEYAFPCRAWKNIHEWLKENPDFLKDDELSQATEEE